MSKDGELIASRFEPRTLGIGAAWQMHDRRQSTVGELSRGKHQERQELCVCIDVWIYLISIEWKSGTIEHVLPEQNRYVGVWLRRILARIPTNGLGDRQRV